MKVNIQNEFSKLKSVIVASAKTYFDHEAINDNQTFYYRMSPPSKELLLKQQDVFFETLLKNNINLLFSDPIEGCPDQHNTRDPSFCIGEILFISSMKENLRKKEINGLSSIVNSVETPIIKLTGCTIEGGDIIVNGKTVYIGISRRTTVEAITIISSYLDSSYNIVPVFLNKGFLHLDTVFNIIDEKTALCCADALAITSLELLGKSFNLINISLEEQRCLGTNVLTISPRRLISQSQNQRINQELRKRKYDVIELEYSEGAKLGGAFRCATCPVVRE